MSRLNHLLRWLSSLTIETLAAATALLVKQVGQLLDLGTKIGVFPLNAETVFAW